MRIFITNALQFITGSAQDFGSSDVTIGMKEIVIPDTFKRVRRKINGATMAVLVYNGAQWTLTPYPNVLDTPCCDVYYETKSTLGHLEPIICILPQQEVSNT